MVLVEWSDDLVSGVRILDGQHKLLTDLLSLLSSAVMANRSSAILATALEDLIDGTKKHFALEERLMVAVSYTGYVRHKEEHDALVERILNVQLQIVEGRATINTALVAFFREWLAQHIREADARLGSYLRRKGLR
jgi:hemerythrin